MNQVKTQCWVIPKRPVHLLLGYMGAGMVLYALLAVVVNLIPQGSTALQATVGTWGLVAWATVGIGLLHEWYDGVAEGWLSPRLQIAVRVVSWVAIWELLDRLFAFRLTAYSVQLSVSSDLPSIALMLGIIMVGLAVALTAVRWYLYQWEAAMAALAPAAGADNSNANHRHLSTSIVFSLLLVSNG